MNFKVLTIFPEMFNGFINESIIGRAIDKNIIDIDLINIRDFSKDKHNKVDDSPYGGGPGMVMTPQPIIDCINKNKGKDTKIIFLSPKGTKLNQDKIKELSNVNDLMLICGRYEGLDQRIIDNYVDEEISIGDYVLTGGELPAMVLMDSVSRLIPGVLGDADSFIKDSHFNGLLDHPQYTRPRVYKDLEVPKVLLSGDHEKIRKWRLKKSIEYTYDKRPDLIKKILNKSNHPLKKEILKV
ncbi:MAG: tRNA (guanosine(37)-N1)-methyltransferase TrmD, partial [Bacillota bacterium]